MDDDVIKYPRPATLFAAACAVLFCVIGIIGNTTTIAALIRCPKLRVHATTFFVLSLSVSDLLFCLINLPLMADRYIYENWRLGDTLCTIFPVILYGNVALSLLNMTAITINRYIIISYYEYYAKVYSKLSIWIQLIFIWCFAFLIMLPPLLGVWGQLGLNKATFSCTILKKDGKSPKQFIFLVGFVIPCLVIIVSYTCIYLKVRKSKRNLKSHESANPLPRPASRRERRDDRRLTKLMLLIFACFVCCFLPLMCANVFDDATTAPALHVLASVLAWFSSVANPLIYVATNKQYRTAYAKLFRVVRTSVTAVSDSRQLSGGGGANSGAHVRSSVTAVSDSRQLSGGGGGGGGNSGAHGKSRTRDRDNGNTGTNSNRDEGYAKV